MTAPRKGTEHRSELAILLRDALPLTHELEQPNPDRRHEVLRRFDIARDVLIGMYQEANRSGSMQQLDAGVRMICEEWMRQNGGKLPSRKGGRPKDEHARLLIWLHVHDAIQGGMGVVNAIRAVAAELPRTYEHVRDIWYDDDPEWRKWTELTLAMRSIAVSTRRRSQRTSKR